MTTIGDTLLIFGSAAVIGFALWAMMVLSCILFPVRSATTARHLEHSFWKSLGTGLLVLIPSIMILLIFASLPSPVTKVIALLIALLLLFLSAIGSGGLIRWTSEKVKNNAQDVTAYGSTTRAALLWVGAINIPFFGWFLIAPLVLILGVGMFTLSLFKSKDPAPVNTVGQ